MSAPGATGQCHNVSFRTCVLIMLVMGLLLSTNYGATTGVLTALETNYGLSSAQLAWIAVSYDIGAIFTNPVMGFYGGQRVPPFLAGTVGVAAALMMAFGMTSSFPAFVTTQCLLGGAASVFWVLVPVHVDNTVPNKAFAMHYTGWIITVSPLGVILGIGLAGAFLSGCDENSEGSNDCSNATASGNATGSAAAAVQCDAWRYVFFLIAGCLLPFVAWFAGSRMQYPPPPGSDEDAGTNPGLRHSLPRRFEVASVTPPASPTTTTRDAPPPMPATETKGGGLASAAAELKRNVLLWLLSWAYCFTSFAAAAIVAFGPRFLQRQLCLDRVAATLLTGSLFPVICFGGFLGGYLPKRWGWGVGHVRQSILMMSLTHFASIPTALIAFLWSVDVPVFLVLIMVSLGLLFVSFAPVVSVAQRMVDDDSKGLAVGTVATVGRVGSITGPLALGHWIDAMEDDGRSPRVAYAVVFCCSAAAAGALFFRCYQLQVPHDHAALERRADTGTLRSVVPSVETFA